MIGEWFDSYLKLSQYYLDLSAEVSLVVVKQRPQNCQICTQLTLAMGVIKRKEKKNLVQQNGKAKTKTKKGKCRTKCVVHPVKNDYVVEIEAEGQSNEIDSEEVLDNQSKKRNEPGK